MTILFWFKFEVSSKLFLIKSLYILLLIKSLMDCPVSMKHNLAKNTFNPASELSMRSIEMHCQKKTLVGVIEELFTDLECPRIDALMKR